MTQTDVPAEVLEAAEARARARAARDWTEADRLRAEIEAAGFKVVDRGTDFELAPARPPDVVEDGRVKFGSSASVPSRLAEAATREASVVLVASDHAEDVDRAVAGLTAHAPEGGQVILVGDDPDPGLVSALDRLEGVSDEAAEGAAIEIEVLRTASRLGHAAALNAGIRRATGRIVVLLDPSIEPVGDILAPLVAALDDPSVAVAGPFGLTTADLREFEEAPSGDVAAIAGYCLAFRRADYVERGPLDEHFRFYRNLDIWWSLVLRDEGPDRLPRRAVAVPGLPLVRHEHRGWTGVPEEERTRLSKRNFYRVLDRFRGRRDLLTGSPPD